MYVATLNVLARQDNGDNLGDLKIELKIFFRPQAGFSILIGLVTQGAEVRSPGPALTCVASGHEIFSTSICPLIHVGQLSVTGTSKGIRTGCSQEEWLG